MRSSSRKKTILIVGAGPNQLPAITMAKQRDLGVVVTDADLRAVGFAVADRYGVVSTRNVEGTIGFAR